MKDGTKYFSIGDEATEIALYVAEQSVVTHVLVKWLAAASQYGVIPGTERLYTWDEYMGDDSPALCDSDEAWSIHAFMTDSEADAYRRRHGMDIAS